MLNPYPFALPRFPFPHLPSPLSRIDLEIEFASTIVFSSRKFKIEKSLSFSLTAWHDDAMVSPTQLRPQCGRNL